MERRVIRKIHARCEVGENPAVKICDLATYQTKGLPITISND